MSDPPYDHPLAHRYASAEMSGWWGPVQRIRLWRQLWVWLAEAEQELGLPISDEQLRQLREHVDDIDLMVVERYERQLRHDVMAHVHAYGDLCPLARPIIHWGATSCYVTDNSDLILIRESLQLVRRRLVAVIDSLSRFAKQHRDLPTLGFTHFQPAQPTTVGKRACLWIQDLVLDLEDIEHRMGRLRARGVKGTTGTQASFLDLFQGDSAKVRELERRVAEKMGFDRAFAVTGQTYPRKFDSQVLDLLSGIAQSAHKMANDLRLLAHLKEIEEPFEADQIGSSAMAYKRNPMRSERICGLSRFVMNLPGNAAATAATQWLERTLDDSANRRLVIPQAFMGVDAILILMQNVVEGLVVHPRMIQRHLDEELPFMVTENIINQAVAAGGDRQDVHELIRRHSQAAARAVKELGQPNDLLQRLRGEPAFAQVDLDQWLDAGHYVGRAPQQVDEFLAEVVQPILDRYRDDAAPDADVRV